MFKHMAVLLTAMALPLCTTNSFAIAPGAGQAQMQNNMQQMQQNKQQMQQMRRNQQINQQKKKKHRQMQQTQ